ncbi:MAG: hypothetical protein ACYC96_15410 [Fimbriimonadaceae bacterium]
MTKPISATPAQTPPPAPAPAASTGNQAASAASNIGPAVKLNLTNVAKGDAAKGDPDHDGH